MNVIFSLFESRDQCDQIGRFMKVLGNKFAHKSSPKILSTFELYWKRISKCKNCCGIYLGNFWKHLGYIFTPISGHSGPDQRRRHTLAILGLFCYCGYGCSENRIFCMTRARGLNWLCERLWRSIWRRSCVHLARYSQCDQIGRFIGLWATFKAVGNN